jgi:hypothetical protein
MNIDPNKRDIGRDDSKKLEPVGADDYGLA